jgi:predicted deacylase
MNTEKIEYFIIGNGNPKIVITAGIHGNEISGIIKVKELKKYTPKNGSILLIPEANKEAIQNNTRTEYYMDDLNRVFFKKGDNRAHKKAREIVKIIKNYNPILILDLHESPHNYDENKDPNLYMGNTVIFNENMPSDFHILTLDIVNLGFTPIVSSMDGTFNKEISDNLHIPVLTIELSKDESLSERSDKLDLILNSVYDYLEIK